MSFFKTWQLITGYFKPLFVLEKQFRIYLSSSFEILSHKKKAHLPNRVVFTTRHADVMVAVLYLSLSTKRHDEQDAFGTKDTTLWYRTVLQKVWAIFSDLISSYDSFLGKFWRVCSSILIYFRHIWRIKLCESFCESLVHLGTLFSTKSDKNKKRFWARLICNNYKIESLKSIFSNILG